MTTTITGADGVSKVQTGAIEHGDLPSGSVLQVVQTTSTTETNTSATQTWVDVAATATITPTSAASKILVLHSAGGMSLAQDVSVSFQLLRGSTAVMVLDRLGYSALNSWLPFPYSVNYVDSPNTTSATTYKFQVRINAAGVIRHNPTSAGTNVTPIASSTVILMEIQG